MTTKPCSKCKEIKPVIEFNKNSKSKTGLRSACKQCEKQYEIENKEKIAARKAKYFQDNKADIQAKRATYYLENKESILEDRKAFYQNNREAILAQKIEYHESNKERLKIKSAKYHIDNPHKAHEYRAKRRATVKDAIDGSLTAATIAITLEVHLDVHSNRCPYCDHEYSPTNKVTLDHIVPIAKGGKHSLYNIQWMCAPCNISKGVKDLDEWLKHIQLHKCPNER